MMLLTMGAMAGEGVPNVVYIISDDQTYRDFGFMGSAEALTPHIDKLAAGSARFVNGYVPSSLCSPSLAVMLTGRYPHESGLHYNHPPPGNAGFNRMESRAVYEAARRPSFERMRGLRTLPRALAEVGYRCLQTGKFWEGEFSNAGFTEGMTVFEPDATMDFGGVRWLKNGEMAAHGNGDFGLNIGRRTMQPIADFLDACGGEEPFLVWYAPFLPHQPHDSPRRFYELYEGRGIAEHRVPYLASVSQFDETVGELLAMLEVRGLTEETLVVLVVDNGWTPDTVREKSRPEEFHYTRRSKYSPFEDGLRTPILLRWPGVIRPGTHETLVSSVDLAPTVLAAVGLEGAMGELPGRSLLGAAMGVGGLGDEPVFGEVYPGDASVLGVPEVDVAYRWVREGRWKLIWPHGGVGGKAAGGYVDGPALFDVVGEPGETLNRWGEPGLKGRGEDLKGKLDGWWRP